MKETAFNASSRVTDAQMMEYRRAGMKMVERYYSRAEGGEASEAQNRFMPPGDWMVSDFPPGTRLADVLSGLQGCGFTTEVERSLARTLREIAAHQELPLDPPPEEVMREMALKALAANPLL